MSVDPSGAPPSALPSTARLGDVDSFPPMLFIAKHNSLIMMLLLSKINLEILTLFQRQESLLKCFHNAEKEG